MFKFVSSSVQAARLLDHVPVLASVLKKQETSLLDNLKMGGNGHGELWINESLGTTASDMGMLVYQHLPVFLHLCRLAACIVEFATFQVSKQSGANLVCMFAPVLGLSLLTALIKQT